jgi:spore coat protein H
MKPELKYGLPIVLIPFLFSVLSTGQQIQTLDLKDLGLVIENSIDLTISSADYKNLKAITGEKMQVKTGLLVINEVIIEPDEIITRGQSTLMMPRKSLSFNLKYAGLFRRGDLSEHLKKFNLLSLSMDRDYCCNRIAFGLMEEIDIFHLFYAYCELRINGKSEGVFMVIEKPEEWAMKKENSPFLINRGYNNNIDKLKTGKDAERDKIRHYRQAYSEIYKACNKYSGEEFYKYLSERLDVEEYMKWLGFNLFVRNGDYTDEVYFYIDQAAEKFRIIPWDYDDLFSALPHEGKNETWKDPGDKLFFSLEDALDRKIINDSVLYNKYLVQLKEVLQVLTPAIIKNIFEVTYSELYPYFSDLNIIGQSQYDIHKNTSITRLEEDLNAIYVQLLGSRQVYLNYLGEKIR